jgi:acetyltransferase
MTDPTLIAEGLSKRAHIEGKPILASWMGGAQVAAGVDVLNRSGIPTFPFPDDAARAFCHMWRYTYNLRGLYETPGRRPDGDTRPDLARAAIDAARAEGRTLLDEHESKAILASYGIPVVPTRVAHDENEAVASARELGFPVAVKLWSRTITHKTDVGGVKVGVADADGVARAFREIKASVAAKVGESHFLGVTVQPSVDRRSGLELIVGSAADPQFGPVLLFGTGGEMVEVFRDRALALPPLNTTLARRMMEQTRISHAFAGVRGRPPVDVEALSTLLVRFGDLVIEHPRIREIDINPLLASPDGLLALDARVVLYDQTVVDADLPKPAIRPYPSEYLFRATLRDGTPIVIRPIRPDDEPLVAAFHKTLSEESVRMRYMQPMKLDTRTAHQRLLRICFIDYDREIALVAEREPTGGESREIVAIGRLSRDRLGGENAEFSLLVADPWQSRGVGREILGRLLDVGRRENLSRIHADVLGANLRCSASAQPSGLPWRTSRAGWYAPNESSERSARLNGRLAVEGEADPGDHLVHLHRLLHGFGAGQLAWEPATQLLDVSRDEQDPDRRVAGAQAAGDFDARSVRQAVVDNGCFEAAPVRQSFSRCSADDHVITRSPQRLG